ncbi:MAG: M16 family metallopeptidase [Nevskiales bacterium]
MRFSPWLALAALLLPAVATPADEWPEIDIPYQKHVLSNGLTLIIHEDHKAPIVAVNVWYHVGSKNEVAGKTGFAHLFEHLMFQGSEHYDDEFFRPLESAGATEMNGTTSEDRTNYFANVPVSALDRLLWLEADRMGHFLGVLTQAKLDEQRGVVKNEKRQRENAPYGKVWDLLPANTYPAGHPYSWTVIGSMADLDRASLEDVQSWFKQYYGPNNAVLVVAGDIKPAEVKKKVERYFGAIPGGPPLTRQSSWVAKMRGEHRQLLQDRVPQARIHKVWNVPGVATPTSPLLELVGDLLAGSKTSRLYQSLVYEQQLATDVQAGLDTRALGSQFLIIATAKPGVALDKLEAALDQELARLLEDGPTADELERVRTGQIAGFIHGLERIGGFGGKSDILASSQVYGGKPDAYQDHLAVLRTADTEQVRDAARAWLSDGVFVLAVEPYAESEATADKNAVTALPDTGATPDLKLPPVQRFVLANGLQVLLAERHAAPVVQAQLIFNGGFAADPNAKLGLASLAMDMLDEGTENYDALALSRELERQGAALSAGAALDVTTVSVSALSPKLAPTLALLAEVVQRPQFPAHELERLRSQRLAAIKQEKSQPTTLALRVLPPLLYGTAHPYGKPLTGSGEDATVRAITGADLLQFQQAALRPDNATLLVVGDTALAQIKPLVEQSFAEWAAPKSAAVLVEAEPLELPKQMRVYLMDRPGAEQSVIIAGHLAPLRSDPQDIPMNLVNTVLGGMFTSRLNLNLREAKHWSYGASSFLMDTRAQRPFVVHTSVQSDKTADAMREMLKELREMRGGRPITAAELATAQNALTLKLPGQHETTGAVLGSLAEQVIYGLPEDYFNRFVSEVRGLRLAEVPPVAQRLLQPQALSWVIVGDLKRIEPEVRALQLGPVEKLNAGP